MLQKMQVSSILSWAMAVRIATSQLSHFQDTLPIATTYLLQMVDY